MKRKRLIGLLLTAVLLIVAMVCQIASASEENLLSILGKTDQLVKSGYLFKSRLDYDKNGALKSKITYEYTEVTDNHVSAVVTVENIANGTEDSTTETRDYNDQGQLIRISTDFGSIAPGYTLMNTKEYIPYGDDSFYISTGFTPGNRSFSTFDPSLNGMLDGKWAIEYDQKGRKTRMIKDDGTEEYTFSYVEDDEGRIVTKNYTLRHIIDDSEETFSGSVNITYSEEGRTHTETTTDANSDYSTIYQLSYDTNNQLVKILDKTHFSDDEEQIIEKDYTYDESGNVASAVFIAKNNSVDLYTKSIYSYVPFSEAINQEEEIIPVVPEDIVAEETYEGTQESLNDGDDISVAMTEPDPSTIKSAGIQTYEDGSKYYFNEITEPLDASADQVFALNITGSDVNGVDENNPAPANSFAIYSSNVFSEENLVANIENGMKDAHGTPIVEATAEPENAGGSGMLLMAAPVRAKAAETAGYNVSVTIPAGVLKPEKTYYFVVNRDMVTNEEDANSTNTDIVFKFSTAKPHVHTEKTVPAKAATCTEPGLTEGKVCEECGEVLVAQEEIPALGHTEEVVKGKAATCTEAGLTDGKKCSVCGDVLVAQEVIPALGHNFKDGVCTRCGAIDPDYKPDVNNDLDPSVNGIVQCPDGRWAMYKNGKVDTTCTTIAQNQYGWWRVENGYVNFDAQGIYQNKYGWWKTTDGKVTFKEFGLFENENGTWRVEFSKVNFLANGIYKGKDGWYKTTNGKVTFDETGIFQNQFGWWYCKNSKVDFDFTGVASNQYGKWYVKSGKVDFTKLGFVKYDGKTYTIMFGKVLFG